MNRPSSQSAVCPIHLVFLQTRCHVWDVKLHVTVALLLMRVTWAFLGRSGLAQPVAVTTLSYHDNCHRDNDTLRFELPSVIGLYALLNHTIKWLANYCNFKHHIITSSSAVTERPRYRVL